VTEKENAHLQVLAAWLDSMLLLKAAYGRKSGRLCIDVQPDAARLRADAG
jgi:hypothetical protein